MKLDWTWHDRLTAVTIMVVVFACWVEFADINRQLHSISTELHRIADQLTK